MVLCSKLVAGELREMRTGWGSPKRLSFMERPMMNLPYRESSSMSNLVAVVDYENMPLDQVIEDIPPKEWKLLSVMLKKRSEEEEDRKLSNYFHRLWMKEQENRQYYGQSIAEGYNRYIQEKRKRDRILAELQRQAREAEDKWIQERQRSALNKKEKRSQYLKEEMRDLKATYFTMKALNDELRASEVAERRKRIMMAEQEYRHLELSNLMQRLEEANHRRVELLKNMSRKTAMINALTQHEASLNTQEVAAADFARRVNYAHRIAAIDARCAEYNQVKNWIISRGRRIAKVTALLRDHIRYI